jgi:hypothetical protein
LAGLQSTRLVPLLGVPKRDPLRNKEMGRVQALGGCQSLKNAKTNQKTVLVVGGGVFNKRHQLLEEVNLAHQDQQWTDGLELPEFQAELEQPEEQNK